MERQCVPAALANLFTSGQPPNAGVAFTIVLCAIFWLSERIHHGHAAVHLERFNVRYTPEP
jgi:hypothetical protein